MQQTANRDSAPLIGVSWSNKGNEKSERYLTAVHVSGGQPVPLPAGAASWTSQLEIVSGLVFTGGGDVDPALYGQENKASRGIDVHRDSLEREALRFCFDRALPVLAICRGLQFVNVALGGSLIQDIQSTVSHRSGGEHSSFHEIEIQAGSRLATIVGRAGQRSVNSRHHQGVSVDRVAPKLRVTALAPDGIVEGLELRNELRSELDGDRFFVAVQCHPEYLDEVPELSVLFATLVAEARKVR